jgi:hypothetical protein
MSQLEAFVATYRRALGNAKMPPTECTAWLDRPL